MSVLDTQLFFRIVVHEWYAPTEMSSCSFDDNCCVFKEVLFPTVWICVDIQNRSMTLHQNRFPPIMYFHDPTDVTLLGKNHLRRNAFVTSISFTSASEPPLDNPIIDFFWHQTRTITKPVSFSVVANSSKSKIFPFRRITLITLNVVLRHTPRGWSSS